VFMAAAAAAGASLSPLELLPVGALVLLGSAIPLNVAGWGPREGVAAWAFMAAGSTAAVGLTVAVTFGVLATVATLPGLLTLRRTRHG
jgi:glycosyltransferase 2 family protein